MNHFECRPHYSGEKEAQEVKEIEEIRKLESSTLNSTITPIIEDVKNRVAKEIESEKNKKHLSDSEASSKLSNALEGIKKEVSDLDSKALKEADEHYIKLAKENNDLVLSDRIQRNVEASQKPSTKQPGNIR